MIIYDTISLAQTIQSICPIPPLASQSSLLLDYRLQVTLFVLALSALLFPTFHRTFPIYTSVIARQLHSLTSSPLFPHHHRRLFVVVGRVAL